jgi:hypothetical protein
MAAGQPINARRHDMKFITETIGFADVFIGARAEK